MNLLLANGVDVNAKDEQGNTSLHLAATYTFPDVANLLLKRKADINARDNDAATPLHRAILIGVVSSSGGKCEDEAGRELTLKEAIKRRDKVLHLLLTHGADVNAKDRPQHEINNNNRFEQTPLHYAALYRLTDVAEILLKNGADVNARDSHGDTPLRTVFTRRPMWVDYDSKEAQDKWEMEQQKKITAMADVLRKYGAKE